MEVKAFQGMAGQLILRITVYILTKKIIIFPNNLYQNKDQKHQIKINVNTAFQNKIKQKSNTSSSTTVENCNYYCKHKSVINKNLLIENIIQLPSCAIIFCV